jgi:hypothetical protein
LCVGLVYEKLASIFLSPLFLGCCLWLKVNAAITPADCRVEKLLMMKIYGVGDYKTLNRML